MVRILLVSVYGAAMVRVVEGWWHQLTAPHQMHGHEKHTKSYFLVDDDAQLLPVGHVER